MDKKEFIKTVLCRHVSIGMTFMGIYNIALLFLYFTHRIDAIPVNLHLLKVDVSLVLGVMLFGTAVEFIIRGVRESSGPDNTSGDE